MGGYTAEGRFALQRHLVEFVLVRDDLHRLEVGLHPPNHLCLETRNGTITGKLKQIKNKKKNEIQWRGTIQQTSI